MVATQELTVLIGQGVPLSELQPNQSRKILRGVDIPTAGLLAVKGDLIVISFAMGFSEISSRLRAASLKKRLRGLILLQDDLDPTFLPALVQQTAFRTVRNILVHKPTGLNESVNRILNAWEVGAADQLIATATVAGNSLLVQTCDFTLHTIPFESLKALRVISNRERFVIARDGSYVHWPEQDIHLDMDALRYAIDPDWREKKDRERLLHNKRFGAAVEVLRKDFNLTQADFFPDVSEREIRRIEKGEILPRVATLNSIAKKHGLVLNDYLRNVADRLAD
jgi:DNA-binding XRE family transcriptional regulator